MLFPLPLQSISLHWSNKKVGTLPSTRLKSFHPFWSSASRGFTPPTGSTPQQEAVSGVLLSSRFPVHSYHNPEKHNSSSRDGGFSGHVAEPMVLVPFSVFHLPYHEESLLKTLHSTTTSISAHYCHSFMWVPGHRDTEPHVTPSSAQDLEIKSTCRSAMLFAHLIIQSSSAFWCTKGHYSKSLQCTRRDTAPLPQSHHTY